MANPKRTEFVSTRPLIEKLGVRSGAKVLLVGAGDRWFRALLDQVDAEVHESETATDFDVVFFRVDLHEQLGRLAELRQLIKSNGAIWTLRRKGAGRTVSEMDTMAAGKAAGLVDVKVVNFSETESAQKFVIPVARRGE